MKKIFSIIFIFIFFTCQNCFALTEQTQEFLVRTKETVTSEDLSMSDNIMAELVSDFSLSNGSCFKKGTKVELMPKEIVKRGFSGRGGYIEIRKGLIKDTKGKEYTVNLKQKIKGRDKDWVIVCIGIFTISIILIPLDLICLVKGGSARLEEGTIIECNISY